MEREVEALRKRLEFLEEEKNSEIKKLSQENLVLLGKLSLLEENFASKEISLLDIQKKITSETQEPNGILLEIKSKPNRMNLLHLQDISIFEKLWTELLNALPPTRKLASNESLLDLLFFCFSTGLPLETLRRSFFVNGRLLSSQTIMNYFDDTLDALQSWSDQQIHFLQDEEWLSDSAKILEMPSYEEYASTLFYFVDGSVIETLDTNDPEASRNLRNAKHKIPAFVFFVMVSPRGRVVYLSEEFRKGCTHDKTHFNSEQVVEKLEKFYSSPKVLLEGKEFQREIGGDKAYVFANKPNGWNLRITKSGEGVRDVDQEGKEVGLEARLQNLKNVYFDPGFASLRGVVERTIHRIKDWAIFKSPMWCSNINRVAKMVRFATALVNFFIVQKGIRQI